MKKIPIATVAISSSTAAVLLVTPVMPKPLSSRYGKSLPAANHLVLVARRARNRQNNHHAGAPANATRIPDMISQAETGPGGGRFGSCVLHDLAPKEHAKKREESPGDDKHGRPPPPRAGR